MEKTKSIRQLDEIGRIVLPFEIRQTMGWDVETSLEIHINAAKDGVIIKAAACQNEIAK